MNTSSNRAGMAVPLILTIILVLAALSGAVYFKSRSGGRMLLDDKDDAAMEKKDEDVMMEKSPTPVPEVMMKKDEGSAMVSPFVPGGTVLAGTKTLLVDFTKADYDKALVEGRIILLYFYANWCPICRAEVPKMYDAFNELTDPHIVGFRVSYNDNETDEDEESLARQFGVGYQHTKVILKGGRQVLKNGETWSKDRYISELTKLAQ